IKEIIALTRQIKFSPEQINNLLINKNSAAIKEKASLNQLLKRPNLEINDFTDVSEEVKNLLDTYSSEMVDHGTIEIKYENYIEKEEQVAHKMASLENMKIITNVDYDSIGAISKEGREKLKKIKPQTIGQATRISGVSPSD